MASLNQSVDENIQNGKRKRNDSNSFTEINPKENEGNNITNGK